MDALALMLAVGAVFWPPATLLLLGAVTARVFWSAYERRSNLNGGAFRIDRMGRVAVLLLVADVAAWIGAGDFVVGREARQ